MKSVSFPLREKHEKSRAGRVFLLARSEKVVKK